MAHYPKEETVTANDARIVTPDLGLKIVIYDQQIVLVYN